MAINFPTSPVNGDIYSENGASWQYSVPSGGVWLPVPVTAAGAPGTNGTNGANGANGTNGLTPPMAMTIEFPATSDKIPILYTPLSFTIAKIQTVVSGTSTPNTTISLRYGPDFSAAGTEVITGGIVCANVSYGVLSTSFTSATVAANNWVWCTIAAVSGTVNTVSISVTTT